MIVLQHVKRRLRRRIVAVVTAVAATGVTTMGIVAFLGRRVGTFTIALDTAHVELSLSQTYSFEKSSSYLWIDKMYPFAEYKYGSLPSSSEIDNEETEYLMGATVNPETEEIQSLKYFKYTFYLRNVGVTPARYSMKIYMKDDAPSSDGRFVSDTLRIQLYANDPDSETEMHESAIYAKTAVENNLDEDGNYVPNEYVSAGPERPHDYYGLAERFESDSVITTYDVPNFDRGATTRFTIVAWLEGFDPQSKSNLNAPTDATIRLGVDINAYES